MIAARRLQRHFADGFIAEAVEDLWEPWMRHADAALEDDALLLIVQQELAKRCKKSKTRGRKASALARIFLPLLSKIDPGILELKPDRSAPRRGDYGSSPCERPGRDRVRSAASGSFLSRE